MLVSSFFTSNTTHCIQYVHTMVGGGTRGKKQRMPENNTMVRTRLEFFTCSNAKTSILIKPTGQLRYLDS